MAAFYQQLPEGRPVFSILAYIFRPVCMPDFRRGLLPIFLQGGAPPPAADRARVNRARCAVSAWRL